MIARESIPNQKLGKRIKHSASTNYHDDTPLNKKLRTLESVSSNTDSSPEESAADAPDGDREIPDSEEDELDEAETHISTRQTELESALVQVRTDKEAIEEYEASRAAEHASNLGLKERLGQRTWVKGKSSIYVDAFNLALETVLEEEAHLFDEPELALFDHWRALAYEAQYLYVRLFLRKTSAWHRVGRLGYYGDIADLLAAVELLQMQLPLPVSTADEQMNPGEVEPPQGLQLKSSFTFADKSEDCISNLDEASSLLNLDELKGLAKNAKVQGKNKAELLRAFRRSSRKQGGLSWLHRTDSEETIVSVTSDNGQEQIEEGSEGRPDSDDRGANRDQHYVRKIMAQTGPCIRLAVAPLKLFERVHLVFYRSTEWTEKSLTIIILARISRRNFPDFIVSRSTNIFPSRLILLEFESAIRTQFYVDSILEFNGTPNKDGLERVLDVFEEVYPRWRALLKEEQLKEERVYESGEGAYMRRFSPAWVYTRIVHKAEYVLGKFKHHKREHELLSELLGQHLFHAARRGAWYQRKALVEEHYMGALTPTEGRTPEAQARYWKRIALHTCEDGLQDRECHQIYHYDLQKRVSRLEKNLKVVKREQHDFSHARLVKPVERFVEGIKVEKQGTPAKSRRGSDASSVRRGGKTIWIDEREGGGECSVEDMCLSWYRSQGWKGYHSEGGIIRTIFAYLFYDVLFVYIPNVFQTAYQTCPLDLHTDAFYPSRASEISHRLVEIGNGDAERIIREVDTREREKKTCVVGLDWMFELDDLIDIVKCFRGEPLATICKVMAQEYRQRGGGIPDLFLWHPERKEVMFAEVKSENDRLSDTQRLWIHVLTGAGIRVELCNAVAKEVRN
ncbi:MAG: hypothetical protein M1817_004906 [Caeruleum heppii]|nr:MAG: hypothetical protein M1817_004906 [Caeruleum heppii]